jgi:hypothetical protein
VVVRLSTTTSTGLQFNLFHDPQCILDLDTRMAHCAFQFGVVEFGQKNKNSN